MKTECDGKNKHPSCSILWSYPLCFKFNINDLILNDIKCYFFILLNFFCLLIINIQLIFIYKSKSLK